MGPVRVSQPQGVSAGTPLQTRGVRRRWFREPKKEQGRAAVGTAQITCAE